MKRIVKFILGTFLVLYMLLPIMTAGRWETLGASIVIIVLVALLISRKIPKVDENLYFIIVKPFLFIYSVFLLLLLINPIILKHALEYEVLIVRGIVTFLIVSLVYYVIKSMFLIADKLTESVYKDDKYNRFFKTLIIFLMVISPDIIFGLTIYDLIYALSEGDAVITNWDKIYFSISQHFMLDKSNTGESIASGIKNDVTGQIAFIAHAIINFFISVTILSDLVKRVMKKA